MPAKTQPKPKPRPVGRPKMHEAHAKSSIMPVRFSGADRAKIEAAARAAGVTVSEWVRQTLMAAAR